MESKQQVEDERPPDQTNYFLEIPEELSPLVASFLYQHEAAKLGEVCRFFYKVSRTPAKPYSPYWKLPFAPRDYTKETESGTFNYKNHNEVMSRIILSNNRIAFIFRDGMTKIINLTGLNKADFLEDKVKFEPIEDLPPTNIFPFMTEVSGKLVMGSNNSHVFLVCDLDLYLDLSCMNPLIKTVKTTFVNTGTSEDFGYLIPLHADRFVAVRDNVLKVFDLSMPAEQECIKTILPKTPSRNRFKRNFNGLRLLSNNQLICAPNTSVDNILMILDLSKEDGNEWLRTITMDDPISMFSILSSGRVVVCSKLDPANDMKRTKLRIIDLTRPEGEEKISELIVEYKHPFELDQIVSLPGNLLALRFGDGQIDIYDCNSIPSPHRIKSLSMRTDIDRHGSLTALKDGRLISTSSSGDICLHNFARTQEPIQESEQRSAIKFK